MSVKFVKRNTWHQWPAAVTFRDVQLKHRWFWIFNPFPDCSMMPFANIISMTNHWSSQLRRQSPNHIILTDLEDLQSFTNLHQTTISGSPYSLLNFTMWSGVVSMFCPEYCTMSPVVYRVIQATPAMVSSLSINMQWLASTKYVIQPFQPTPWPSTAVISSKETLRFQGVERKVPPAASQASLIQRRIIQKHKFLLDFWQQGTHEPSGWNNKTIMFWCVTAIRIKRIQFSESAAERKWIWWALDGQQTKLSQFPAWQMPVSCSWSGGSSCMPYYLPC